MTFGSPFPDVVIPETSVYEHVFGELSPADAERIALVEATTGSAMTYGGLVRRIDAFARMLADRGVGVGDVVALLSPNSSAFAGTFHGILRVGATATTINLLNTASDIAKQLTDSRARLLFTVEALRQRAIESAERTGLSAAVVVVIDDGGETLDGDPDAGDLSGVHAKGGRLRSTQPPTWRSCPIIPAPPVTRRA